MCPIQVASVCTDSETLDESTGDAKVVEGWGYYETIAGGAGAGPTWNGQSGVHTVSLFRLFAIFSLST